MDSLRTFLRQAWEKRPDALRWLSFKAAVPVAAFAVTGIFITFLITQGNANADAGHAGHEGESEVTGSASKFPIVTVEQPKSADSVQVSIEAAGQVFAQQQADLFPSQDGVIQSLSANLGSRVRQGQVLATLRADQSQQQLAAEIAFKQKELEIAKKRATLTVDSHIKAAEQERESEFQKLDVQATSLKKEQDAELQKIDAEIAGLQKIKEQRLGAVNSAAYDLLDSLNEVLFTRSDGISNYFNNSPFDYYRRKEIVMPNGMDRQKFEYQIIEFERKIKAGATDPLTLITEASEIGQKARQISLSISESPAFDAEEVDRIRKEVAEVTDHLLEITTDLTEADSEVKSLEAEKLRILATTDSQIGQLAPERTKLQATTQQKIVEIQGGRKNADLDAEVIAADIVRLQQQVGAGRTIVAPFSGVITKRYVNAGESVTLEKPVFNLIDDSRKYIRFNISEADLPFVKVGTTVTFSPTSAPSEKFTAVIKRIAQSVDPDSRTIQVEADVPTQENADRILAQMTIRVQIPVTQDPALLVIPEAALQLSKNSNTVWTVSSDVTAVAKPVEIAFVHSGYAYVKSGLTPKDWIIVKSPVELTAGLEIDTKQL